MFEVAAAVITEVTAVRGEGANVVYIGREGFACKMGIREDDLEAKL